MRGPRPGGRPHPGRQEAGTAGTGSPRAGRPVVHRRCRHNPGVARLQARLISREGSGRPGQGFGPGAGANGDVARDQPDGPDRDRCQSERTGQNAGGTTGHRSAAANPAGAGAATIVPYGRDSRDPESGLGKGLSLGPSNRPDRLHRRGRCHRGGPHRRRGTVTGVMRVSLMGLGGRRHEGGEYHEDHRRQQAHNRPIGDHETGSHLLRWQDHARLRGVTVRWEVWSADRSFKGRKTCPPDDRHRRRHGRNDR